MARGGSESRAAAGSSPPTSTACCGRERRCRSSPSNSVRSTAKAKPWAFHSCSEKEAQVGRDQAEADGGQKAPLLPPRGGGLALAARWPVHRASRVLRSDAGPGGGQDRRGQSEALAPAGRSAEGSRPEPVEAGGDP